MACLPKRELCGSNLSNAEFKKGITEMAGLSGLEAGDRHGVRHLQAC
jgi:hypothetical protein